MITTDHLSPNADGSGTRRVVQVLTMLGVRMVSEDPETYDIHVPISF